MSRQEAFDIFSSRFQIIPSVAATGGYSVTALCLTLLLPCRMIGGVSGNDLLPLVFASIMITSFITSCIMIEPLRLYWIAYDGLMKSQKTIGTLEMLNNCVDPYTQVDL